MNNELKHINSFLRIIKAQNKKIEAELELIEILCEYGNTDEAKPLISRVCKDITALTAQDWYKKLLTELKVLSTKL